MPGGEPLICATAGDAGGPAASFLSLAYLLMPADPSKRGGAVRAGLSWRTKGLEASGGGPMVWGEAALPSGTSLRAAISFSTAREAALLRLLAGSARPLRRTGVHRLPPPVLRPRSPKNPARAALLGGALVELVQGPRPERILDVAAAAAGVERPIRRFRAASGGAAMIRVRRVNGEPAILRVARAGAPADPSLHTKALTALARDGMAIVPRLLATGATMETSWSAESIRPGRRPVSALPDLAVQVASFCAGLPRRDGPPAALAGDLEVLADRFPDRRGALAELAARVGSDLAALPTVARHGDLWSGNLLVTGRVLTGVLDWDSWDPAGVPGTDLLHLVATEDAHRTRRSLGAVWLDRPWRGEVYRRLCQEYWRALRVKPDAKELDAVGIAWWACYVANALIRLPELARDDTWLRGNVERVLEELIH